MREEPVYQVGQEFGERKKHHLWLYVAIIFGIIAVVILLFIVFGGDDAPVESVPVVVDEPEQEYIPTGDDELDRINQEYDLPDASESPFDPEFDAYLRKKLVELYENRTGASE